LLALPLAALCLGPLAGLAAPTPALDCPAARTAMAAQASELLKSVGRLDVLLLGEIHTSEADHAWQLASLEAVRQRRAQLVLGLEMVPAARQAVLDRYSDGRLEEAAFLQQVGWQEVWGHDPDLYLPLLRWARRRSVPLLALNAEPATVRRVRREGLKAVPRAQREDIAPPAAAGEPYRRRLEASWAGHSGIGGPLTAAQLADRDRFIDSQLLRDRAMGERIAAAHRRDPDRLVVALIGSGHLEGGDGVPRQLLDLGLSRQLSLSRIALPGGCGPAPTGARLGAYLESENGAVWIRRVAPGSAAAAAGLRPGDRILELDGTPVEHAGQVIRGVRLHPQADPLRLTIERAGRRLRILLLLPPRTDPQQAGRDNGSRIGDVHRPTPGPLPG
ncbi:MAG: ChaN family lipoprotein, partial [Cyanobium sp.]